MSEFGGAIPEGVMAELGDPEEMAELEQPPVEPAAPAEPSLEPTPEPVPEAAPAVAPPEPSEPSEPSEPAERYAFAGREFASAEEAERSYREMQDLQRRSAEDLRAERAQRAEITAAVQRLVDQRQAAEPPPLLAQLTRQAEEMGVDPEQLGLMGRMAQVIADQRVAQVESQLAERDRARQMDSVYTEVVGAVEAFRTAHPDVTEDAEAEILSVLDEIGVVARDGTGKLVLGVDQTGEPVIPSVDAFEIAHEVATNPQLRQVLRGQPALYDTDEGMAQARLLASLMASTQAPAAPGTPAPAAPATLPHTEKGGATPPPAATEGAPDPLAEMVALAQADSGFFSK